MPTRRRCWLVPCGLSVCGIDAACGRWGSAAIAKSELLRPHKKPRCSAGVKPNVFHPSAPKYTPLICRRSCVLCERRHEIFTPIRPACGVSSSGRADRHGPGRMTASPTPASTGPHTRTHRRANDASVTDLACLCVTDDPIAAACSMRRWTSDGRWAARPRRPIERAGPDAMAAITGAKFSRRFCGGIRGGVARPSDRKAAETSVEPTPPADPRRRSIIARRRSASETRSP